MKKVFLESFANDPAQFIQTWLESQSRDLESILGSGPTEGNTIRQEELRRSEFFQLPWVEEVRSIFFQIDDQGAHILVLRLSLFKRVFVWLRKG